jgi:hypothetical protein
MASFFFPKTTAGEPGLAFDAVFDGKTYRRRFLSRVFVPD